MTKPEYLVKVTQYGRRLNGKYGITGVIEGKLSATDLFWQHAYASNRGEQVKIESLDGRQAEVDKIAA